MQRRDFIKVIAGAAAVCGPAAGWPAEVHAQQVSKTYRVAYLALAGTNDAAIVNQRLKELGYEEGKNLIFDLRSAQGQIERLSKVATDLVATHPDVIITGFGTATAKAAQAATKTIPIVFSNVGDPIGSGIVQSSAAPAPMSPAWPHKRRKSAESG